MPCRPIISFDKKDNELELKTTTRLLCDISEQLKQNGKISLQSINGLRDWVEQHDEDDALIDEHGMEDARKIKFS